MNNITDKVYNAVTEAFNELQSNNFAVLGKPDVPMWENPLAGTAAGDDDYYGFLKEHIGEFHWTPAEVFALKYDEMPDSSRLRAISIVFPMAEETRMMQSREREFPCASWAVSRGEWDKLIREYLSVVGKKLDAMGVRWAAPELLPEFSLMDSGDYGRASRWSHRHNAFACGMGTFGLSDGFITEKGMAVRFTSVIVEADMDVTPRGDRGHYDWCLYFRSGICGACIRRCPKRAISEKGHDKEKCASHLLTCFDKLSDRIDTSEYREVGCGLCHSKVPCMDKKP